MGELRIVTPNSLYNQPAAQSSGNPRALYSFPHNTNNLGRLLLLTLLSRLGETISSITAPGTTPLSTQPQGCPWLSPLSPCGTVTSFLSTSAWILACVTAASRKEELACLACSIRVFSCCAVLSRELTISSRYSQLRCSVTSSLFTTDGDMALVGVVGGTASAGREVNTGHKEQKRTYRQLGCFISIKCVCGGGGCLV